MAVDTYYFDASDEGPTDPDAVWNDDANAFDGNNANSSVNSTSTTGSKTDDELSGGGTTANGSGTITQVRSRHKGSNGAAGNYDTLNVTCYTDGRGEELGTSSSSGSQFGGRVWSNYITLDTPSGGWTWAKLAALEVVIWFDTANGFAECTIAEIEVTSEAATGTNTQINIGDDWKAISAAKVNIGDDWKDVAGIQVNIGDAWKEVF